MKKLMILCVLYALCGSVFGANEINAFAPGVTTAYAVIREVDGDVWYPAGQVFEAWGTGARTAADYDIALTDKSGDMFVGSFDTNVTEGVYHVVTHYQAGGSPADSDPAIWQEYGYWDGSIWTSDIVAALPTKEQIRQEIDANSTDLNTLTAYAQEWDPNFTAILADTNDLQTWWADGGRLDLLIDGVLLDTGTTLPASIAALVVPDPAGTAAALHAATDALIAGITVDNAAIADAVHDEVVEGTITLRQAMRLFLSVMTGKSSGGGTTSITFRDVGDTKNRLNVTVDSKGNRTAVNTRDGN